MMRLEMRHFATEADQQHPVTNNEWTS